MRILKLSSVKKAAQHAGMQNIRKAAEILRMIVALKNNEQIYETVLILFGNHIKGPTIKRRFYSLLQGYIIHNYPDEFRAFCMYNNITIFNKDLEVANGCASNARLILIVFLREEIGLKPPFVIEDDIGYEQN
jgi:hypothetical protein